MGFEIPHTAPDGFDTLERGVDAGRAAIAIGTTQVADARDVTFRGGRVRTRPAFRKIPLSYSVQRHFDSNGREGGSANSSQSVFETGRIQGASFFDPLDADGCLMTQIDGRLFRVNIRFNNASILDVTPSDRNPKRSDIAYMVQADRFHITQDGTSMPIIYDGSTSRRAVHGEVPPGTIMAYGMGRLIVVSGPYVSFGDIYGANPSDPSSSVLTFSENNFLAEGGPAVLPAPLGAPSGMIFLPQQDSSTGQGELLVIAENGVASFYLSIPRSQWKDSAFQRVALLNTGGRGHRARTSINADIWFRATDGWRLYRQARAEIAGWAQVPLSTEIRQFVEADTTWLLKYGSVVHLNQRMIGTANPIPNQGKPYHPFLTSLDFDVISAFGKASSPAWDGAWRGPKVTILVDGVFQSVPRAFAFGIDENGHNALYEVGVEDQVEDWDGPISSYLITRGLGYGSTVTEKEIIGGDVWVDEIKTPTTLSASFRTDESEDFQAWHTFGQFTPVANGATNGFNPSDKETFQPRKTLPKPANAVDSVTGRNSRRFFEVQVKLDWTGYMETTRFRLTSKDVEESPRSTNAS
jgi:hypothetical protein